MNITTSIRAAKMKNSDNNKCWHNRETDLSYIASANVKWYTWEISLAVFLNNEAYIYTTQPFHSLVFIPKKQKPMFTQNQ